MGGKARQQGRWNVMTTEQAYSDMVCARLDAIDENQSETKVELRGFRQEMRDMRAEIKEDMRLQCELRHSPIADRMEKLETTVESIQQTCATNKSNCSSSGVHSKVKAALWTTVSLAFALAIVEVMRM